MANRFLTPDLIAAEAVMCLENELVMSSLVHRAEDEFTSVNGYKAGDTVNLRRPAQFEVRNGAIAAPQDIVEGKVPLVVDTQQGIDVSISSKDMTLSLDVLSQRVIRPAMIRLANALDQSLMNLYQQVPAWVGTPGQTINSFADLSVGIQRLDDKSVPSDDRACVLTPADYYGLLGSQTGLYIQDAAKGAYREGSLGKIAGVTTMMAQNTPNHTVGSDASGTVNAAWTASTISYSDVKDTDQQTITVSSLTLNPGDVFTIGVVGTGVHDVNAVTKARLPFLKQFRCVSMPTSTTMVISPALIWNGAFQNGESVGQTDLNSLAITAVGTAATVYPQNMIFHRSAFALACVPMETPAGAASVSRKSWKGLSVRFIQYYDGPTDVDNARFDILYGVKAIDPRLAVRVSGT